MLVVKPWVHGSVRFVKGPKCIVSLAQILITKGLQISDRDWEGGFVDHKPNTDGRDHRFKSPSDRGGGHRFWNRHLTTF